MAIVLALTALRPAPGAGPFARDFEAYYAAGATWNAGADPWSRDVWNAERRIPGVDGTRDEVLPFVGPAASLPLWSLLARWPFAVARAVWEALLVASLVAVVAAALALGGVPLRRGWPAFVLAAASGPAISAISLGQVALLAAAGVATALAAFGRAPLWAGVATIVAGLQPNLALPLAVRLTDRRAAVPIVLAALAFIGLTLAAGGGPAGLARYARVLQEHAAQERFIAIQYTVPAIAASFGATHALATLLGIIVSLAAAALAGIAAVRLRAQPLLATCVAIALLPLIVPFFHEHDFVLELIPAIVLAVQPELEVRIFGGIAAAATLVDWFGMAQRPGAVGQTIALAVAVACAYALLAHRDDTGRRAPYAALDAALLFSLVAMNLARAAPAPVWPDALGAFHAPAGATIGAVWGEEQRRSGLAAASAAWGALRALPLGGCVLWAVAALRLGAHRRGVDAARVAERGVGQG